MGNAGKGTGPGGAAVPDVGIRGGGGNPESRIPPRSCDPGILHNSRAFQSAPRPLSPPPRPGPCAALGVNPGKRGEKGEKKAFFPPNPGGRGADPGVRRCRGTRGGGGGGADDTEIPFPLFPPQIRWLRAERGGGPTERSRGREEGGGIWGGGGWGSPPSRGSRRGSRGGPRGGDVL